MSRRFKNQKKENEDGFEGITIRRTRNLSPNNPSGITERIIKYFEDPKDSKALAEIKRLSNKSKKSSKNIRSAHYNFGDSELRDNTERNRLMFKEPVNERAVKDANATFIRRKKQFATTRYEPRNKNMTLYDELKLRENKNDNKNKIKPKFGKKENEVEDDDDDDDKFDLDHLNENKDKNQNEVKEEVKENKDFNANRFARYNIRNNYKRIFDKKNNTIDNTTTTSTDNAKTTYHHSSLRRSKKPDNENNSRRARFAQNIKPIENISNNMQEENNDVRPIYKPSLTEDNNDNVNDVNLKKQEKIENKNEEKKPLKKYKTEFVWDKTINRLVERRIYSNQNDNKRNKNNRNIDNENDENNKNLDKEEKNESKKENKNNEARRFGNKQFPKNNDNMKKEENKPSNDNQFKGFRGYRFYRRYRKSNTDQENQESEKPEKEEIIIEKKTVTTIIEDTNGDIDRRPKKPKIYEEKKEIERKPKFNEEKPKIINKEKIIVKKEEPKISEEKQKINEEKPKENEENKKKYKRPGHKVYKKRNFDLKLNDVSNEILNDIRNRSPEQGNERNLTQGDYKDGYKKRQKYEPQDLKSKVIYTKKIKVEEKKIPQKEEILDNEGEYPNKKKNIRINIMTENLDEEKDDNKDLMKNNPYTNYLKGKVRPNKGVIRTGKTDSELYDDFTGNFGNHDELNYRNYTTTNDYEIKMGDPNKRKIPYVKRVIHLEDLED